MKILMMGHGSVTVKPHAKKPVVMLITSGVRMAAMHSVTLQLEDGIWENVEPAIVGAPSLC